MTRLSFTAKIVLAALLPALPLACGFPDTYGGFDSNSGGASNACPAGFADCDPTAAGCETEVGNDPKNCGACGTQCTGVNATATCSAGKCVLTCAAGFGDCNDNAADGCEANLTDDTAHCGTCATKCSSDGGTASCVAKVCEIKCGNGFADCNGLVADGCEVNTGTDPTHCGTCATLCPSMGATATCTVGTCGFTCKNGFGDCDSDKTNACETELDTNTNCGGCGTPCSYPNAVTTCATGTCELVCTSPFADCDNNKANGCESDTSMDDSNCGKCGAVCGMVNAPGSSCAGGKCSETCSAGFADCNGLASDGCEAKLSNNIINCGMCGQTCQVANGTGTCSGLSCQVATCNAPDKDCNGAFADGCEANINTDPANCGGCGMKCTNANGPTSCVGGTCVPTCNAGFADCDGNVANGCEASTNSLTNCGGCGIQCKSINAVATCPAGTCNLACSGTFKNCDGNGANGCETNTVSDDNNCGNCNMMCSNPAPFCITSTCKGCTADVDEPNEDVQQINPPIQVGQPPPGIGMRMLNPVNNTFPMTGRTASYNFTMSSDSDVDVHYFQVTEAGVTGKVPEFLFKLSNIPAGAVYELDSYYICTVAPALQVNVIYQIPATPACASSVPNSDWTPCMNPAPAPTFTQPALGYGCGVFNGADVNDSGIMQVAVTMVTPPTVPTCSPYTLTITVTNEPQ